MISNYFNSLWSVTLSLAPSLLLGLGLAGLLHAFLPRRLVQKGLSRSDFKSVLNSVLIGIPMPLCSCGVVPAAIGLKNDGASKGAATGFLISTPQTGVDSIAVSASILGLPFALFKVLVALISGLIGGVIVNATEPSAEINDRSLNVDLTEENESKNRVIEAIRYAIFDLLAMIDIWLIVGVAAAALIAVLFPTGTLSDIAWIQGIGGMLLALAISMPLYICTTSSVPIAASLITAGMPLGTALVFLMAGPATNIATVGAIFRGLGGRVLAIYLSTVAILSILFGLIFDSILAPTMDVSVAHHHEHFNITNTASAILLIALLILLIARRVFSSMQLKKQLKEMQMDMELKVGGMNCQHCVANVKKSLEAVEGVEEATPDLSSGLVFIKGENLDRAKLASIVTEAGYKAE